MHANMRRHNTQRNDTQQNDIRHCDAQNKGLIGEAQHK